MTTYQIIKQLESEKVRKFNEVFLVELNAPSQPAILKVMKKTAKNHYFQELLRKESQLKFEHPNLPKTLLFEEDEQEIRIVKTYFPGETLDSYWKKIPGRSRVGFTLSFLKKIAELFDELKSQNLVHGDIKASNIVIAEKGDDFEVYLIDFGLSFVPTESKDRKLIFALAYSPPEFILNKLHLANQSSDIYALGITLYQLFSGKLPFSHANPAVLTNLQIAQPIENRHALPQVIYDRIAKMCFKGRFKNAPNLLPKEEVEQILLEGIRNRYQDLHEVLDDLTKAVSENKKPGFWNGLVKIFSKT